MARGELGDRVAHLASPPLMGYPPLLENDGQCVPGIGTGEARWIRDMGQLMADMMGQVAAQATSEGIPTSFSNPIDDHLRGLDEPDVATNGPVTIPGGGAAAPAPRWRQRRGGCALAALLVAVKILQLATAHASGLWT